MRKIGINLHAMPGMTDEAYIQTIADLGFTATFDMSRDRERMAHLAALCATKGISFENLHAPFTGINSIWLPGEDGDRMLEKLKYAVDNCLVVGAPMVVVHLSSGKNPPTVTDLGRGRFKNLVEYAVQKGVKIAFENQRKLFNLAWALEYFGPETGVGFCWDCGHEGCFTPGKEFMPLFGDRLLCTHIHDNDGVADDDRHLLPFDGKLDFDRIARQLREANWEGSLMLEVMAGKGTRYANSIYDPLPPEQYLTRAAEAVKRLAEML